MVEAAGVELLHLTDPTQLTPIQYLPYSQDPPETPAEARERYAAGCYTPGEDEMGSILASSAHPSIGLVNDGMEEEGAREPSTPGDVPKRETSWSSFGRTASQS